MVLDTNLYRKELDILELTCFPFDGVMMMESEQEVSKGFIKGTVDFIDGLIQSIRKLVLTLVDKIKSAVTKKHAKEDIKKFREKVARNKQAGKTEVEFYDVWTYESIIKEAVKKLDKETQRFLREYRVVGASLGRTDKEIDKLNKMIDDYTKRIDEIKNKKIKVPIEKLVDWLDDQISKDRPEVFSFVDEYENKLNGYIDIIKTFDDKAQTFADENGMIRRPKGVTEHLKNFTSFIHRNGAWFGTMIGSTALTLVCSTITANDAKTETDKLDQENPSIGDSIYTNAGRNAAEGEDRVKRGQTNHPKATRLANLGNAVGIAGFTGGSMGAVKAKLNKRNSV